MSTRIPPINCLITFETLANLRSVTKTADALCVCVSTVSQRIRLLENIVQQELFSRTDFSLNQAGNAYLDVVHESLNLLRTYSVQNKCVQKPPHLLPESRRFDDATALGE